jgi:hypothetical protein
MPLPSETLSPIYPDTQIPINSELAQDPESAPAQEAPGPAVQSPKESPIAILSEEETTKEPDPLEEFKSALLRHAEQFSTPPVKDGELSHIRLEPLEEISRPAQEEPSPAEESLDEITAPAPDETSLTLEPLLEETSLPAQDETILPVDPSLDEPTTPEDKIHTTLDETPLADVAEAPEPAQDKTPNGYMNWPGSHLPAINTINATTAPKTTAADELDLDDLEPDPAPAPEEIAQLKKDILSALDANDELASSSSSPASEITSTTTTTTSSSGGYLRESSPGPQGAFHTHTRLPINSRHVSPTTVVAYAGGHVDADKQTMMVGMFTSACLAHGGAAKV